MKSKSILGIVILAIVILLVMTVNRICQAQTPQKFKTAPTYSGMTAVVTVKAEEVSTKDDIEKVKQALSVFGYKIFNFKINFEKKQVLVRMRKAIEPSEIVNALHNAGYTSSYNKNDQVSMQ